MNIDELKEEYEGAGQNWYRAELSKELKGVEYDRRKK